MGTWTPGAAATAGADTYTGDNTAETVDGLAGDDTLTMLGGDDGDDIVFSGRLQFIIIDEDSNYRTSGGGHDVMDGGAGDDIAVLALSDQTGAIVLTMNAATATSTYTVGGSASGASLTGFDRRV